MLKIVLILLECESTMLEQSICNHVISASSASVKSIKLSTFDFQLFSTVTLLYPVVVGTLPHSQLNGLWKRRKLLIRKLGSEALNKEIGLFGLQHPLSVAAMKLQTYSYPVGEICHVHSSRMQNFPNFGFTKTFLNHFIASAFCALVLSPVSWRSTEKICHDIIFHDAENRSCEAISQVNAFCFNN